jgi:CDP-diacylglycerol--serine O-phosphatidyltransferase
MNLERWFPPLRHAGLANAVTSLGAASAVVAMAMAATGHGRVAFTLLALSLLADRVDGAVARARGEQSAFGVQMDSLADLIAFVVTPAIVALTTHWLPVAWTPVLVLYVLAGTWRLAHFNVAGLETDGTGSWFRGHPTTDTAAWLIVLASVSRHLAPGAAEAFAVAAFAAGAVLMVSGIRYPKNGWPQRVLLVLVPLAVLALWVL